jgi:hypothetical protein
MLHDLKFQDLGLDPEEAEALMGAAQSQSVELFGVVAESETSLDRITTVLGNRVKDKTITPADFERLRMVWRLKDASVSNFARKPFEGQKQDGYFSTHESFGEVHRSEFSSNDAVFVGNPSQRAGGVSMKFSRGELKLNERRRDEAHVRSLSNLVILDLAPEQFALLLRNANSSSPCRLSHLGSEYLDAPPRLINAVGVAAQAREEAMQLGVPLQKACDDLRAYLQGEAKISKKSDFAELVALGEAVRKAMDDVVEPMRALLMRTAGLMADSASKQLIEEIAEPLQLLGMDPQSLMKALTGPA